MEYHLSLLQHLSKSLLNNIKTYRVAKSRTTARLSFLTLVSIDTWATLRKVSLKHYIVNNKRNHTTGVFQLSW